MPASTASDTALGVSSLSWRIFLVGPLFPCPCVCVARIEWRVGRGVIPGLTTLARDVNRDVNAHNGGLVGHRSPVTAAVCGHEEVDRGVKHSIDSGRGSDNAFGDVA